MNVFVFSGNCGSNAELRATPQGQYVCQFNVAATSGYGEKKQTTWVRCSLWGKRGESVAPYLLKGTQIVVSGEIHLHTWHKDGQEKTSLECRVNDVTLVGGKKDNEPRHAAQPAKSAEPAQPDFDDSDLPF